MGRNWLKGLQDFLRAEEGASSVEYALLISGIAAAIAGAITLFGSTLNQNFTNSRQHLFP